MDVNWLEILGALLVGACLALLMVEARRRLTPRQGSFVRVVEGADLNRVGVVVSVSGGYWVLVEFANSPNRFPLKPIKTETKWFPVHHIEVI